MTEGLLTAFSGHAELHLRVQPLRRAIVDESVDFHGEEILVRRLGAGALQPQTAFRVPHGQFHWLAVELQTKHADLRRDSH